MRSRIISASLMLLLVCASYAQTPTTPAASEQSAKATPTGLFVKFRVKPGKNAAFEAAFREMQQSMRDNEPGNVYYDLFVTPEDPQLYVIMERYKDAAAVTAHGQTEHLKKVLAQLRESMDGRPEAQLLIFISGK